MVDQSQPGSRRQRRIDSRRNQILDAAAGLFAERGFHRATTRDIAQAADVSEGTLYNYFESKDALLLAIMTRLSQAQHLQTELAQSLPYDARDFLVSVMHFRKEFVEENNAMLQSVLSEILVDPELRQHYYQELLLPSMQEIELHLRQRSEQGQISPMDAQAMARILTGLMVGLYILQVLGDPLVTEQWERLSISFASALFEGLAPRGDHPRSQT